MNDFARNHIDKCWTTQSTSITKRLERSLSKDGSQVFDLIDQLARSIASFELRGRHRDSTNSLRIVDWSEEEDNASRKYQRPTNEQLNDTLRHLNAASSTAERHLLKEALDALFLDAVGDESIADEYENEPSAIKSAKRSFLSYNLIEPCKSVCARFDRVKSLDDTSMSAFNSGLLRERIAADSELARLLSLDAICRHIGSDNGRRLLDMV